jgi:hypothetical protein
LKRFIHFTLIIIVSVFSKYYLFLSAEFNLESDQSLSLLMSKRILGGQDFPFFYWGQNYMGMAEIWFSLPLQYILGSELRVFLISQVLLSILISYLIYYSFLLIHKEVMGVIFSFLFAFGHPFLNKHLLNVSENFGFSLLIGVLGFYFIYQFNKVKDSNQLQKKILLLYGIALGFSLYNREILLFIFPFVLLVSFKQISLNIFNFVILIFGTIIGYIPGFIHYLRIPYYKKLIRPSFKLNTDLMNTLYYSTFKIPSEIMVSGELLFQLFFFIFSFLGILLSRRENNIILLKYFSYYLLGVLSTLFIFLLSASYSVDRYYFYLSIGFLFFSSYSLSILYEKNKKIFFVFILLYLILYIDTYTKEFKKNIEYSKNIVQLKEIANHLKHKNFQFGIAEYWSAYTVQYFSRDTINFLIYMDKQSDLKSTIKVLENKAEFFLFHKDSTFENYFLKNRNSSIKYEKEEVFDYVIYIPEYKTLDFLEDSREKLLEEWRKFK